MRILVNAQPLLEAAGGVRTYVAGIIDGLQAHSDVEHLLLTLGAGVYQSTDVDVSLPLATLRRQSWPKKAARAAPRVLKVAAKSVLLQMKLRQLTGFTYHEPNHLLNDWLESRVLTVHDLTCLTRPQDHPRARVEAFRHHLARSVSRADAVITVSESVRTELLDYFGWVDPNKVRAVPLGVRMPVTRVGLRPGGSNDHPSKPYFLAIGALEPRKNLRLLAEAATRLDASGMDVIVVHAGPAGWRNEHEMAIIRSLSERGIWRSMGVVGPETLDELYENALCLVFPSFAEGFGLPPLEAMARGTPVIASKIPVHQEVLGHAALYCDPNDCDSLASQMSLIAHDDALRLECNSRGLARVREFTWKKTIDGTIEVYRSVGQL